MRKITIVYVDTKKQPLEEIIKKISQDTFIDIPNIGMIIPKGIFRIFIFRNILVKDSKIIFRELENESMKIKEEDTSWWERNGTKFAILVGSTSFIGLIFKILDCSVICLNV